MQGPFFSSGHRTESEGWPDGRERQREKGESEVEKMKEQDERAPRQGHRTRKLLQGENIAIVSYRETRWCWYQKMSLT